MNTYEQDTYYPAVLGAGLIAGLRSFSAPAAVSSALAEHEDLAAQVAPALRALAATEMLADKMPFMPDRTSPPALAGRILIGAVAGAAVAAAYRRNLIVAAALAGAASAASSYLGLALRRTATEKLGLPDPVVALAEDAVVVMAGRALG